MSGCCSVFGRGCRGGNCWKLPRSDTEVSSSPNRCLGGRLRGQTQWSERTKLSKGSRCRVAVRGCFTLLLVICTRRIKRGAVCDSCVTFVNGCGKGGARACLTFREATWKFRARGPLWSLPGVVSGLRGRGGAWRPWFGPGLAGSCHRGEPRGLERSRSLSAALGGACPVALWWPTRAACQGMRNSDAGQVPSRVVAVAIAKESTPWWQVPWVSPVRVG